MILAGGVTCVAWLQRRRGKDGGGDSSGGTLNQGFIFLCSLMSPGSSVSFGDLVNSTEGRSKGINFHGGV